MWPRLGIAQSGSCSLGERRGAALTGPPPFVRHFTSLLLDQSLILVEAQPPMKSGVLDTMAVIM